MKYSFQVALITVVICLIVSALITAQLGGGLFLFVLGAVFLVASFITAAIGLASTPPENRKAYFLTAGIVLLLGMGICGPILLSLGR